MFAVTVGEMQFLSYCDMLEGGCLTPEGDVYGPEGARCPCEACAFSFRVPAGALLARSSFPDSYSTGVCKLFLKRDTVNIFSSAGHSVSVLITQALQL